jgi:hypothetical protein
MFQLKHPFDNDYKIPAYSTSNLMDYTPCATHIAKWQWDLIHDPGVILRMFERDKDAMVYTANDVKVLLDTIRAANNSVTVNVPAIVRYQDIVDDTHFNDSASLLTLDKNEFLSSFTHEQTVQLAETLKNRIVDTAANMPSDYNPIILANKVKVTVGGKLYKLTINGYAMTKKIYTTYIAEDVVGNEHKLIFYNATKIESNKKEKAKYQTDTSHVQIKNIRKAFDIVVHTDSSGYGSVEDLKKYLKIKGKLDLSGNPTIINNGITLHLRRVYSNTKITIGELTIDGDPSVKLITVELKKGTKEQSQNNCDAKTPNKKDSTCFRIYKGTYDFELNETLSTTQPQHRYKSLRLNTYGTAAGGKRNGILVHTGWNYSFTEGCILTMNYNDVQTVIDNPQSYLNSVTGYIDSIAAYDSGTKTKITFKNDQTKISNGTKITFTGFTGYTGYNATFTANKIDDRNIAVNHAFNEAAIADAATFTAIINDGIINVNWNNSAPTTMSLYDYVEKFVPNGINKGRIVITEDDEIVDKPSVLSTFLQNVVEALSSIFNQIIQ